MSAYRDTASFGKRHEYSAIAEILKRGFDVYMTLLDDRGVGCLVRLGAHRYVDTQIKARSKDAQQWNPFAAMDFEARPNLFFLFYLEKSDSFWTMPSAHVAAMNRRNQAGANAGRYTLDLPIGQGAAAIARPRSEAAATFSVL